MEFSPRAALCTAVVFGGFAALATAQLPFAFLGLGGAPRDGLLSIARGSFPRPGVERDILGAVLRHEARRPGRLNVCLRLSDQGRTLEREKRAIRGLQDRLRNEPEARIDIVAELRRLATPTRTWLIPSHSDLPITPLAKENSAALHLAEERLVAAPAVTGVEIELDGSAVPAALQSRAPGCSTLFFSAPAVAGEIAFVETRFSCGAGCGEEWLHAVVLRDGRWAVAAVARP